MLYQIVIKYCWKKLKIYHATNTGFLSPAFSFSSHRAQMDSTVSIPGQHRQTLLRRALLILVQVSRFEQNSGFISNLSLRPVAKYWRPTSSPHPHTSLYPLSKRGGNPSYVPFCKVLTSFPCEAAPASNLTGEQEIPIEHFSPLPGAPPPAPLPLAPV